MTHAVLRRKETVFGTPRSRNPQFNRTRVSSVPEFSTAISNVRSSVGFPPYSGRLRADTEPSSNVNDLPAEIICKLPSVAKVTCKKKVSKSILDDLLRQEDNEGRGLSRAVITEVALMIWMMMEAGQAWSSMALSLLSVHGEACRSIQTELDDLVKMYGDDRLFAPYVLSKMERIDALIYEAIRLCPEFLGGMKVVNETVEVEGFQIPKHSNVIFSQPSEEKFDLRSAIGKKPESMGMNYPSVEL